MGLLGLVPFLFLDVFFGRIQISMLLPLRYFRHYSDEEIRPRTHSKFDSMGRLDEFLHSS